MGISKTTIRAKTTLGSFDDVDKELLEMNKLQSQLDNCQATYQAQIEDMKEGLKKEATEIMDKMNHIAQNIHIFSLAHQNELDGRSKKLNHGKVGFKHSTTLSLPKNTEKVIEALKRYKRFDLIEVTEKVKKSFLKKEKDLAIEIGGSFIEKDNFRIELPEHIYDFEKKLKEVKE